MIVNRGIRSRKMVNLQLQIHKFADKKTAYNEVHLYAKIVIFFRFFFTLKCAADFLFKISVQQALKG